MTPAPAAALTLGPTEEAALQRALARQLQHLPGDSPDRGTLARLLARLNPPDRRVASQSGPGTAPLERKSDT